MPRWNILYLNTMENELYLLDKFRDTKWTETENAVLRFVSTPEKKLWVVLEASVALAFLFSFSVIFW